MDLSVQPSVFLRPGLGFLEEGVYEYKDAHLETKSGQTILVFISGGLAQQETSHSDTICTINLSGREHHNRGPSPSMWASGESYPHSS